MEVSGNRIFGTRWEPTIQAYEKDRNDVKKKDSRGAASVPIVRVSRNHLTNRQKTALTTLGMFLDGFLVSPAVIPRLSVPPSIRTRNQLRDYAP